MFKLFMVMSLLFVCCLCIENSILLEEETRAKKKKGSPKLLGLILLFALSKIAIFKTVSVFLMMTFFQKLFTVGGILLKYFLRSKSEKPSPVYGPPTAYDTVGYSYGPPREPTHAPGAPGAPDIANFDWLVNKNV